MKFESEGMRRRNSRPSLRQTVHRGYASLWARFNTTLQQEKKSIDRKFVESFLHYSSLVGTRFEWRTSLINKPTYVRDHSRKYRLISQLRKMSESNIHHVNGPVLANAGTVPSNIASYRNSVPHTINVLPTGVPLQTLPPRPEFVIAAPSFGLNQGYTYGGLGSNGMGGMGSYGMNSMASMGGYGGYGGMGGYSSGYGMGGMGMGMGMNNQSPYGYGNVESRFIQLAEENTRPAFESIQSLVSAVGGVSMMLENTFFALTSSFRAILGVAENFGRLRSLFSQFWTAFGLIRSINWLIRKLSVMLGIRTEAEFKAWAEAVAATQTGTATQAQQARGSGWPVLLFFGIIAAAPYILLKMMSGVTDAETPSDPRTWKSSLRAVALSPYQATSTQELSFQKNQVIKVAPQNIQGVFWNSGWLIGTTDGIRPGIIPSSYIKIIGQEGPVDAGKQKQGEDDGVQCPMSK